MLRSVLQTYDQYLERSYKGLEKEQQVPVEKATLGRVGIATGYKTIEAAEEKKND